MTKGFGFPPDLDHWQPGDVIVRREVLRGQVWSGMCMYVIQHTDDLLVLYLPENTPIGFGNGTFPTPDGGHPWNTGGDVRWQGHGILQLHRPDDAYSVWVFWAGADRAFRCWVSTTSQVRDQTVSMPLGVSWIGAWRFRYQAESGLSKIWTRCRAGSNWGASPLTKRKRSTTLPSNLAR